MTTEQTNGASSPSFSSAELERLLDEWAEAAGHIWMSRSGEQATAWHVRREDLAQLARAAALIEREACANVCDNERSEFMAKAGENNGRESDFAFGSVNSAERIAAAIRMRSNVQVTGAALGKEINNA